MLTLEEEGAYIRLLAFCWQHGSIPSDPESVARLIGKGASIALATAVLTMFQPSSDRPDRLNHDRLDKEREKQSEWRRKSSAGGKKSSEQKAVRQRESINPVDFKGGSTTLQPPLNHPSNHSSTTLQPPYQPNANSLSLSLSSSLNTNTPPTHPVCRSAPVRGSEKIGVPVHPLAIRIAAMVKQRPTTAWKSTDIRAFQNLPEFSKQEIADLERFYADGWEKRSRGETSYIRGNLSTLLNNFESEINKAKVELAANAVPKPNDAMKSAIAAKL